MIIWINGTFGSGKTTTGGLLADSDARLRTFDPEWVGYMLRNNLTDHEVTDFQQFESWRRLTPVVADEIVSVTGQSLVAIQTVLDESHWDELTSGLSALGHQVIHVVLAPRSTSSVSGSTLTRLSQELGSGGSIIYRPMPPPGRGWSRAPICSSTRPGSRHGTRPTAS